MVEVNPQIEAVRQAHRPHGLWEMALVKFGSAGMKDLIDQRTKAAFEVLVKDGVSVADILKTGHEVGLLTYTDMSIGVDALLPKSLIAGFSLSQKRMIQVGFPAKPDNLKIFMFSGNDQDISVAETVMVDDYETGQKHLSGINKQGQFISATYYLKWLTQFSVGFNGFKFKDQRVDPNYVFALKDTVGSVIGVGERPNKVIVTGGMAKAFNGYPVDHRGVIDGYVIAGKNGREWRSQLDREGELPLAVTEQAILYQRDGLVISLPRMC